MLVNAVLGLLVDINTACINTILPNIIIDTLK